MGTLFFNLPVPVGHVGPGAAVDLSAAGPTKTIVIQGGGAVKPIAVIEVCNDTGPTKWAPLATFVGPGEKTFSIACRFMRVNIASFKDGRSADYVIDVGTDDAGTLFAHPLVPIDNIAGAGVDTSAIGTEKTVQIGGTFVGAINIEASEDNGLTYATVMSFSRAGIQTRVFVADKMRVSRNGINAGDDPGTPTCFIAACEVAGGGGSVGPTGPDGPTGPTGPSGAGTVDPVWYGNGAMGDLVFAADDALLSDLYAQNITVNDGVTIDTNGFRIFATGIVTLLGTGKFVANGNDGVNGDAGGAGGLARTGGTLPAGVSGGPGGQLGGNGGDGSTGDKIPYDGYGASSLGGNITTGGTPGNPGDAGVGTTGGGGGGGDTNGGGSGGVGGNIQPPEDGSLARVDWMTDMRTSGVNGFVLGPTLGGGGAGGGAGSGDGSRGGGGGSNGGLIIIAAKGGFAGTGGVESKGGNGAVPSAGGGGGGGGGGAGGPVVCITPQSVGQFTPATITTTGGVGAAGDGGGAAGGNGGSAVHLVFRTD